MKRRDLDIDVGDADIKDGLLIMKLTVHDWRGIPDIESFQGTGGQGSSCQNIEEAMNGSTRDSPTGGNQLPV